MIKKCKCGVEFVSFKDTEQKLCFRCAEIENLKKSLDDVDFMIGGTILGVSPFCGDSSELSCIIIKTLDNRRVIFTPGERYIEWVAELP